MMSRAAVVFLVLAIFAGLVTVLSASEEPRTVTMRTRTMGAWASLSLVTADSAAVADLALEALLVFHRVDSLMTNWTDISEVARLNREAAAGPTPIEPEVGSVLETAARIGRESQGTFDISIEPLVRLWGFLGGTPHVPANNDIDEARKSVGWDHILLDSQDGTLALKGTGVKIDLGGIAKGHGVDMVADHLRAAGVTDALVDLTGNMVALGSPPQRDAWLIGIRDPHDNHPHLGRLHLSGAAIATSGNYQQFVTQDGKRYGHILNPLTGWPADGIEAVTVVTERAIDADAWATALFVMGPETARKVAAAREDLAVILIEAGENDRLVLWIEKDLHDQYTPPTNLEEYLTVRIF